MFEEPQSEELKKFAAEREAQIASYTSNDGFQARSLDWVLEAMNERYVYNFDWAGRPVIQYPQDIVAMQEIVWATRPDIIVETGIAHGGSLALSASLLTLLDVADAAQAGTVLDPSKPKRKVIAVDIDIRAHNRALIEAHPFAGAMELIEGSSIDPAIHAQVMRHIPKDARVMVCLDSNHTHDHVMAELELYAPLVSPDLYCVVFDTFIEDAPVDFIKDRPWNKGNNPATAIEAWLKTNSDFEIDEAMHSKLMITGAKNGFLKRCGAAVS